ncbi:hypothetical protein QTN93_14875 [Sphingomonas aerolata]|uniref:hypothetical protein n=1 Tax=Sphingomonas aerolata TaxID=185951 RepID=UPI0035A5C8F4
MILEDGLFPPLMGSPVGTGSSRVVLEYFGQPDCVIKVGYRNPPIANWTEWNLWLQVENDPALAPVFGRCLAISASGKFLVMERLNDLTDAQAAKRLCPPWVTDKKRTAFGVNAAGDVKLRDYNQLALGSFLSGIPLQLMPA